MRHRFRERASVVVSAAARTSRRLKMALTSDACSAGAGASSRRCQLADNADGSSSNSSSVEEKQDGGASSGAEEPTCFSGSRPAGDCEADSLCGLELDDLLSQGGRSDWDVGFDTQLTGGDLWLENNEKADRNHCGPGEFSDLLRQLMGSGVAADNGESGRSGKRSGGNVAAAAAAGAKINKNAVAARLNRLKKKEYVMGLETRVNCLASENQELKDENRQLGRRVKELEEETRYLKAVLANESVLSQLLCRLTGVNGLKLTTSLYREAGESDHDYALPRKRLKAEEETSGGICLHVDKEKVSVEFCASCARNACASVKIFFFR
ncbi:CREB/ATF bZIP transcription factor [Microcaecilia unicolor]|uniref:X-box-binding protein 1 n=1 Tax=Microcaecilia unicolor TaxID=1415580 RepID=A0A6P7XSE4_9AMPH|nr:CREB/ATF bZIP transcription factor [Microcaecilia unicolor]XP_030055979.1 CREB/ATF bZIP transcription factor [Microcaecilia unicolor]XP_030055980.1 CREB/ATF bZIP transcription factor [Microcaecilia unicolor]XP_030055981.1 CREB/ATF bZIP transcription factor [Microcaecilia unicolor]